MNSLASENKTSRHKINKIGKEMHEDLFCELQKR